jgi:N-acetylmuramoyl-L-alanine amidase
VSLEPVPTKPEFQNNNSPEITSSVGIVAGHWGNDPGAVCSDGLTEAEVNLNIATIVQKYLVEEGLQVDLLKEFDDNLSGYKAAALVSIHADSCDYINDLATGFKVAQAMANKRPERSARLTACLRNRYSEATGLLPHSTSVTEDMTSYHAFSEIDDTTPAVIIETGFLNLDRQLLTQTPEIAAQGIASGIICFIRNESITATPEAFSQ